MRGLWGKGCKEGDCGERDAEKGLWGKECRREEGTVVKGMQTRGEGSVEKGKQGGDGGD